MADKIPSKRNKPVSQKRVAVVLASLVGTMTVSAALLLALEGGALGTGIPAFPTPQGMSAKIEPAAGLQAQAWNYIIIYESGDLNAGAASLAEGRMTGGNAQTTRVRPKANFHFVIDSAQSGPGTMDGFLEVGTSWQQQTIDAPHASWPDTRSHSFKPYNNTVGICLIGDLARKPLSEAQQQTLLQLVQTLQKRFNIPKDHVLFQWDTKDALPAIPAQAAYAKSFRIALP